MLLIPNKQLEIFLCIVERHDNATSWKNTIAGIRWWRLSHIWIPITSCYIRRLLYRQALYNNIVKENACSVVHIFQLSYLIMWVVVLEWKNKRGDQMNLEGLEINEPEKELWAENPFGYKWILAVTSLDKNWWFIEGCNRWRSVVLMAGLLFLIALCWK